jgi:hypothetical protein
VSFKCLCIYNTILNGLMIFSSDWIGENFCTTQNVSCVLKLWKILKNMNSVKKNERESEL